jgi:hypothetical protein
MGEEATLEVLRRNAWRLDDGDAGPTPARRRRSGGHRRPDRRSHARNTRVLPLTGRSDSCAHHERGFGIVAVEADWPDAYRANRWVRGLGSDAIAEEALADFTRFPRWMWRNHEVVRFLRWLRAWNSDREGDAQVGF